MLTASSTVAKLSLKQIIITKMAKTTPKRKSESVVASMTADQFNATMVQYSANEIEVAKLQAEMDEAILEIMQEYESDIELLKAKRELYFAQIKAYAVSNRDILMPDKAKSVETVYGKIGFRISPPSLKLASGVKWDMVVERLKEQGLDEYVRTVEETNKEKLLADREKEEVRDKFGDLGIKVDQPEKFYIELNKVEVPA